MNYYIAVFKNTSDVMAADKILGKLKCEYRIMPTPTNITLSCGMCIRIDDKTLIDNIIDNNIFEYKNIYYRNQAGYEVIEK